MSGLLGGGGGSSQNQPQQAPLAQFNVQSSAYGQAVPLVYGRNRIPANLIWYGDFTAIAHETSYSAGKGGGGGSSSISYTYTVSLAFGLCEGAATAINNVWIDKAAAAAASSYTKFLGTSAQSPWTYLSSNHPTQALNYRGHCYAAVANLDLGSSANTGNHSFDVTGLLPYSAGTIDNAEPSAVVADFLTNTEHGSGLSNVWLGSWTQFSNYCIANDLFIAPVYTAQQDARQHLTDLFTVLNSGAFFSEGKLKIVPFSDTAATAHTITYTPNNTPSFSFTDDDYLDDVQPLKVSRTATADAYNHVQVEFLDASNSYNKAIAEAKDQASIEVYGLKPMQIIKAPMITSITAARMVAQLILQRVLYTRNMYEFRASWKYCQLEPCDYITLTDSRLGLTSVPARVLAVEEDEYGQLTITAEDAPAGVSHSALYSPQAGSGYVVDFGAPVLNVQAPVFFEVPANASLSGLAVGVAVTGQAADANWGGCEIYASNDGTNYSFIGRTTQPARYGVLTTANITSAVAQTPRVLLSGRGGQIITGSTADAANDSTECVIFNPASPSSIEYADYTTSTLNATNDYTLTLAVRGTHSTTAQAHSIGDTFIRVDGAIAYSNDMALSMIGKTMYFKFLSFNIYGGAKQNLASVTAYTYTILGNMASLPPAQVSGLTTSNSANSIFLQWSIAADLTLDHIEIYRSGTNIAPGSGGSTAALLTSTGSVVGFYADYIGAGGVTYYYWMRTVNKQGYPSAFTASVTGTTGTISGGTPGPNSITNAMLQTDCVQAANIFAGSVGSNKIAANAIVSGKIAAGAITAAVGEIGALAVSTLMLQDNAVTIPVAASVARTYQTVYGGTMQQMLVNVVPTAGVWYEYTEISANFDLTAYATNINAWVQFVPRSYSYYTSTALWNNQSSIAMITPTTFTQTAYVQVALRINGVDTVIYQTQLDATYSTYASQKLNEFARQMTMTGGINNTVAVVIRFYTSIASQHINYYSVGSDLLILGVKK